MPVSHVQDGLPLHYAKAGMEYMRQMRRMRGRNWVDEKEREEIGMITTNTTASRAKEDDGKRRVVTTTTMKPGRVRFVQKDFPGVNKRETNTVDPKIKFNTTELNHLVDGLMNSMGYKRAVKAEPVLAPAIKTPQPKVAKKVAPKKRKT
jgi:hypothetical protein